MGLNWLPGERNGARQKHLSGVTGEASEQAHYVTGEEQLWEA